MQNTLEVLRSFLQLPQQAKLTLEIVNSSERSIGINSFTIVTNKPELNLDLVDFKSRCLGFELDKLKTTNTRTMATYTSIGQSISEELLHYFMSVYAKTSKAKKRTEEVRDLILNLLKNGQVVEFPVTFRQAQTISAE